MTTNEPTMSYKLWVMDESDTDVFCEISISYGELKISYTVNSVHDISWRALIEDDEYEFCPDDEAFFIKKKDGFVSFITPSNFLDADTHAEATFTIPSKYIIDIAKQIVLDPTFVNPPVCDDP